MKPKKKTKMKKGSGLFSTTKTVSNEIFNLRETLINDISRLVEERLRTCGNLKVNGSDKKKELEKIIKKVKKVKGHDESKFIQPLNEISQIIQDIDDSELKVAEKIGKNCSNFKVTNLGKSTIILKIEKYIDRNLPKNNTYKEYINKLNQKRPHYVDLTNPIGQNNIKIDNVINNSSLPFHRTFNDLNEIPKVSRKYDFKNNNVEDFNEIPKVPRKTRKSTFVFRPLKKNTSNNDIKGNTPENPIDVDEFKPDFTHKRIRKNGNKLFIKLNFTELDIVYEL